MSWLGTWRNQYGSTVTITGEAGGRIEGSFRTAIESSPFFGSEVSIAGAHSGPAITFGCAADGDANVVVSYTGKLQDDRMETLWFVADGDQHWWKSVVTNHDTFERVS